MALMPEDLQNKRFTPVRFSEGYDMDEVDNYLDNDVMPRLQELIDENARLTQELEEAHNRIAQLESGNAETDVEAAGVESDADAVGVDEGAAEPEATEAVQPEATEAAPEPSAPADAAGIIALANRLHDEYVRNGEEERDRLVTEANAESRRIIGEAEETSRSTLEALETQRTELEETIDSLRTFERDYRNRLRNYLENQLRELDTSDTQDKQSNFGL